MVRLVRCWTLALLAAGASPLLAQGRGVVGVIRDSAGTPIHAALVTASGQQAYTDTTGRFAFAALPIGRVAFSFRRMGFEPVHIVLELTPDWRDSLSVTLAMLPRDLPGLTTVADARMRLMLADYFRHKDGGTGRYLEREQLTSMRVGALSDVLRRIPGVRVVPDRNGRYMLRMGRSTRNCSPDFWIDNVRAAFLNVDDVPLTDIEAIEVYNGPSGLPPEYNNRFGNPSCGAVVIWTRVPG